MNLYNIKMRYIAYLKSKPTYEMNAEGILVKEGLYYKWSDLDCSVNDVALWQGMIFLNRTLNALRMTDDKEKVDKLKDSFLYWIDNDFQNTNWWYNQIGVPSALCDLVILLENILTQEQIDKTVNIIDRGSLKKNGYIQRWTGANLIWGIWTTAKHALITGDSELLKTAINRASEEIFITEGVREGIKADFSFFQHGPQHYTLGYGRSFTISLATLVYILSETDYQFHYDKLEILIRFMLEGQIMMMWGKTVDYLATGREYSRFNSLSADLILESALLYARTTGIPYKEKIEEFIRLYKTQMPYAAGIKYFDKSLILVNRSKETYVSVKGVDHTVTGTESLNRENFLAYNFSYGTNICCMSSGKEYDGMFALWDYSMMPGTTSFVERDEDIKGKISFWANKRGGNKVCGGKSKDGKGALYMELVNTTITGLISYIAYEKGMLVLGSGITCSDVNNGKEIRTNINQCIAEDNFKDEGKTVINGSFKYHNLCVDKPLITYVKETTGNMRRNNLSNPDIDVTGKVFYTGLSHGKKTLNSKYAYCITGLEKDTGISRFINNDEIQGAEFTDGGYILIFHKPGEYLLLNGDRIESGEGVVIG